MLFSFLQSLSVIIYPLLILAAIFFGLFLFWRSGSHELYDSNFLFDFVAVSTATALLAGRVFDFLTRSDFYNWSVEKLIFFNVYPGLNLFGVIFGIAIGAILFMRKKKKELLTILDLAAPPLTFSLALIALFTFSKNWNIAAIFNVTALFIAFWALKRFETEKKHAGFFACLFLTSISSIELLRLFLDGRLTLVNIKIWIVPAVYLPIALISWYFLATRKPKADIKSFFAAALLVIFGTKRVVTSVTDADKLAKNIVLMPLILAKFVLNLVKLIGIQIGLSLQDLVHAFGIKK